MADIGIRISATDEASGVFARVGSEAAKLNSNLGVTQASFAALGSDATKSLGNMEMSARATAAAMRGVPAQFTDIITSLQGGQKPLTVLLQQGGQLKDMFGGIGGAAQALGTYVVGLVNPFTVAAAAVGVLGYAFLQGKKESQEYNRALIETGNAAGTTATRLAASASNVSKSFGVTQGAAAAAIAAFAAGNNVSTDSFEKFSGLAVRLSEVSGKAVGDTVKQFEELGKSPVEASAKLNESTHYLTASVYEQIKALSEQGKTSQAAAVAQKAYYDAMSQRLPALTDNLGILERGWNSVSKAAKGAWDSMLNIGRPDTIGDQIAQQKILIAQLERPGATKRGALLNLTAPVQESDISSAREKLKIQEQAAGYEEMNAFYQKKAADQATGQIALDEIHKQYLRDDLKMQQEIAKVREQAANAPQSAANTKKLNESIAGIREKYAGEGPKAALATQIQQLEDLQAEAVAMGDRNAKLIAAQHAAQLLDDTAFYAQKHEAALKTNADQQAIVEQEIAAVSKSGLKSADKTAQLQKYNSDLKKLRGQALGIEQDYADALVLLDAKDQKIQDDYIANLGKAGATESKRLTDAVAAQTAHNAEIGKTKEQIEDYKRAVEEAATVEKEAQADAIAALLEKNAALIESGATQELIGDKAKAIYEEELKNLKEQIALRKQLATGYATGAQKEAAAAVSKASTDAWKKGWEETDRLARDVFTTWATEGGNAAQKIGDTLKKALLSAIYEATIKPIALQIYTSIAGQGSAGAIGSIVGGASGGTGSLSSLSSLSSLYGYGSKAASTVGGWLGFGGAAATTGTAATTGAALGGLEIGGSAGIGSGTALGGAAAGGSAGMAGFAGIPVVGWIVMGMMASADAYDKGFRTFNQGGEGYTVSDGGLMGPNGMVGGIDKLLTGLGLDGKTASILSGSALGAQAMYTLLGGYQVSNAGSAITGTIGGSGSPSLQRRDDFTQDHRGVLGIGSYTTHNSSYSAADPSAVNYIDGAVKVVNASVKQFASTLGLSADAVDGYTKQIDISLSSLNADEQKAAIDKAITGFMDDLVTAVYGTDIASLQKSGETSSQTLVRLSQNLSVVNGDLETLGYAALKASISTASAASGLIEAAGGTDKLQASVSYYYANFRSESEKSAAAMASLSNSFAALGIDTIPASKAAFDALLSGIDLTTESGQKAAAGMLALAPAFDQVASNALAAANKMLGALQDYGTSDEVRAFQVAMIQKGLADGGVNLSADQIANATRADARTLYETYAAQHTPQGDRAAEAILNQSKAFAAITQAKAAPQVVGAGSSSSGGDGGAPVQDSALTAWQDATDAIIKTMSDLRTTLLGSGPDSFAKLQAQFAIEAASAKAGNLSAAQDLPALAKALVDAGKSYNTTSVAQALLTARVIDTLGGVVNASSAGPNLSIPHFAAGGYHDGGWAMVGEQGPELVNLPKARVFNANDTRSMLGGADPAMLEEMRAMRAELTAIRASTGSTALATRQTAKVLDAASNGGQPISTRL